MSETNLEGNRKMSIDKDYVFEHSGLKRTYKLYQPKNLTDNAPMVFLLHGMTSSSNWTYITGFNELAEKHGFLVVYPQSHHIRTIIEQDSYKKITDDKFISMKEWFKSVSEKTATCKDGEKFSLMGTEFPRQNGAAITFTTKWNDTDEDSLFDGQNDVVFLTSLAKHLQKEFHTDAEKTFVAGFSNGGYMSYSLIAQARDIFKAAAIVSGLLHKRVFRKGTPKPTPIIHLHGTDDFMVPIEGQSKSDIPSAQSIVEYFANLNKSVIPETIQVTENARRTIYTPEDGGAAVHYYRIENHDHVWPGRPNEAKKNMIDNSGINATELIWEFFAKL